MREVNWSYGGGTQSVAIAVLVLQGRLGKPDRIVFADTGREKAETWRYTERYVLPALASIGLTIEVAPHSLARRDVYADNGDLLVPAYTAEGMLPAFCSVEWKRRVVRRYLRAQGVRECITWLGMSTDEVERLKPSDRAWQRYHWPLCFDVPMNRANCHQLVLDYGWPQAPRSCCWMCSYMTDAEWQHMKDTDPGDWRKAVAFGQSIAARDQRGGVYLHRQRKPLEMVKLGRESSPTLWGCESGFCFT